MLKRTSPCSPPPRAACLRCERGEGLGVGALSSLSLFASAPPPLAPPHSHPATQASRGPRLGEGNAPSLRLAFRHIRWPCATRGGIGAKARGGYGAGRAAA